MIAPAWVRLTCSRASRHRAEGTVLISANLRDGDLFKNANPALRTGLLSRDPCGTDFSNHQQRSSLRRLKLTLMGHCRGPHLMTTGSMALQIKRAIAKANTKSPCIRTKRYRASWPGLSAWLRERFLVVDKNEQSAIASCHFEEPLIFQRELKNKVACSHRNKERQKADAWSKTAGCPK